MEDISGFITTALSEGAYKFVLSGKREKTSPFRRVCFTFLSAENEFFVEKFTDKQVFHSRVSKENAADESEGCFCGFSQINAWSERNEYTARLSKKGKLLCGRHSSSSAPKAAARQNREKSYLIPEGCIVPPLVDMGVMNANGDVKKPMFDKFRQINRFLEFIDDCIKDEPLPEPSSGERFSIIDFGCGKSYLTFIVYYYFSVLKHIPIRMVGIDLKEDVIEFCSSLAEKYGYDGMEFICGDIAGFDEGERVDMVISLHACDTATDYALYNAIKRDARFILSVPCCQHELNKTADLACMPVFDDDGILRERMASLLTDGIRAKLLTVCGYRTQLMEFVDLSHTPKNILIRAKRAGLAPETRSRALAAAEDALSAVKCEQTLHRLLREDGMLDG